MENRSSVRDRSLAGALGAAADCLVTRLGHDVCSGRGRSYRNRSRD